MFERCAAQRPKGVLQALGESDIALAAQYDMDMFEAGIRQPEVVEAVFERRARNRHAKVIRLGKIR